MPRPQRLIFLAASLLVLVAAGALATGSLVFVHSSFWFAAGFLMLLLISTVDQPFFSKDAHVFMNGATGLLSLLLVQLGWRGLVWWLFMTWMVYLVVSSFVLMLHRSKALAEESRLVALVSRLNRQLGRPQAVFSAFFLWGAAMQFGTDSVAFGGFVLYWAVFTVANTREVSSAIADAFLADGSQGSAGFGVVRGFASPRLFECEVSSAAPQLSPGVKATVNARGGGVVAQGAVLDDRVLNGTRLVRVAVTEAGRDWRRLAEATAEGSGARVEFGSATERRAVEDPVGVVGRGSDINALCFLAGPDLDLSEGEIVAVGLPTGAAYYQVVGGTVTEDRFDQYQCLQNVEVVASQLGKWDEAHCRFEPVGWVAPAGALVARARPRGDQYDVPPGSLDIGRVPNSSFPVHLDVDSLVTHNTAILGVTGSGKSYLALWVLNGLLQRKIKVLVLDVSRQYYSFLHKYKPYQIKQTSDIPTWLGSEELLAIHQFATSNNYPSTCADMVKAALQVVENQVNLEVGQNEPARLCIVFEEAHSLIPEWNQVAQRGDEQHVNSTARVILQGRKYGVGCLVVSQRTANVTKTILNQCNTIIAMQSFDQTGLDFLGNYMGADYVRCICSLPSRHGVLVGKASSSSRPVLFTVRDLSDEWTAKEDSTDSAPEGEARQEAPAASVLDHSVSAATTDLT